MYVRVGSSPAQDAPEAEDGESSGGHDRPGLLPGGLGGIGEQVRAARALLDRPLTSYYLIVGITTLLLCLGLMMVLSTGSVIDPQISVNPLSALTPGFLRRLLQPNFGRAPPAQQAPGAQ